MRIATILCLLLSVWLTNCAAMQKNAINRNSFEAIWSPALEMLNHGEKQGSYLGDDLSKLYAKELVHIGDLWSKSEQAEGKKNQFFHDQIALLNGQEITATHTELRDSYRDILSSVLKEVEAHPTASTKNVYNYDEGDQIGFCFGRALLVHYLLLKHGIPRNRIRKIFALGDLLLIGQFWRFHVAMAVEDKQGLLVVDPLYGEPAMVKDWMDNVEMLDVKRPLSRTRFYLTDPRKFMPASGEYSIDLLKQPELRQYFEDMAAML